jgi:hypothetical protein
MMASQFPAFFPASEGNHTNVAWENLEVGATAEAEKILLRRAFSLE